VADAGTPKRPFRTTHQLSALRKSTPTLSAQTQLLGRYESPGMTDERYLLRRSDGQIILLTMVLYVIASGLEEHHDLERVARDISARLGQPVTVDTVAQVIDAKIKPLGILDNQIISAPVKRQVPLLSLTMRGVLVPPGAVRFLTRLLLPLYWPATVALALIALGMADYYTFGLHGVSSGFSEVANKPVLFLPVFGLVVLATLFHEIGHATACAYGGGEPGRIGYGIYLIFPAFYTDVTDTYRLPRGARVRTDLGGVYFNGIFIVVVTGIFVATSYVPIIPAVVLIHITMIQQMLPVVRLDGYYVLSDLVGVPDLFGRIKPLVTGLIPGRSDPHVDQLHASARRIVTAWVLISVPVLVFGFGLFIWHLPKLGRDTYHSAQLQWTVADLSYRAHHWATASLAAISLVLLSVPVLGLLAFGLRLVKRIPVSKLSRTEHTLAWPKEVPRSPETVAKIVSKPKANGSYTHTTTPESRAKAVATRPAWDATYDDEMHDGRGHVYLTGKEWSDHPLWDGVGLSRPRLVVWEDLGCETLECAHPCHWCGETLAWIDGRGGIHIDHLNGVTDDDRPENLVVSCRDNRRGARLGR
jgi:putative peptide zinc metalloprotease protein